MRKTKLHVLNKFLLLMATCFFWQIASGQDQPTITVSGTVIDSVTSEPIIGAVIAVKGTTKATTTDIDGKYTIDAPTNGTLVVSYAGYAEREIAVNNSGSINFTLREDTESLQEIVAIGYGTQERSDVTGSVSTVKTRDLTQVVVTDPTQAIQGRVTGVTVAQNTGAPGSPVSIIVRGAGSVNATGPLYVVNGIPIDNIAYLNTNDIESIDILKDASTAAVYGSRAANGVVVITTRKGSARNSNIEFRYLTGLSQPWKERRMLDGKQWATLVNEAYLRDNGTIRYNPDTIGTGTDWQKEIFRKAKMNSYYLSTGGGSDKYNYYVSSSYLQQQGIVKTSDYSRFNVQMNGDYMLSKKLKAGAFINTGYSNNNKAYEDDPYYAVLPAALKMDPITAPYTGKGGDSAYASGQPNTPGVLARTDAPNPLSVLYTRLNNQKTLNLMGSVFAEYEILQGLKFKTQFSGIFQDQYTSQFNARFYSDQTNQLKSSNVHNTIGSTKGMVWENSLAYDRTFAQKHKVGVLLLTGYQTNRYDQFEAAKSGTSSNDPSQRFLNSATSASSATVAGYATESSLLSYMGRIQYEFNNKYAVTANVRRDGSSRFLGDNRWSSFPSVAAGWKVSNEEFFAPLKGVVSFFKLRGSLGKLGNQNLPGADYPYTTLIYSGNPDNNNTSQEYVVGGQVVAGASPRGLGNKNVKWETVTMANVGADFGFLNDRILFTVEYFTKKTSDMLIQKSVPLLTGIQVPPYVNYGAMLNKGLELSLELRNQEHALKYRVAGNFTSINNKVTKMGDPINDGYFRTLVVNQTVEGKSIAQFYGYQVDGIVQTQQEAQELSSAQPNVKPGDFKYKDLNGDGKIDASDRTYLGSPLPKFNYGFSVNLEYKGVDLSIFFQGVQGNKIFNGAKYDIESGLTNSNFTQAMLGRWTGEGSTNSMPRIYTTDANNNKRASSYYIEDGSYLRLKSLQLGYTIPEALGKKFYFQKLRVYVAAQNLLTFTKYTGLDPEIGRNNSGTNGRNTPSPLDLGIDRGGTYPQARTFQLGVNATF